MHVDQHQVGLTFDDHLDRGFHVARIADEGDVVGQLAADSRPEQVVVIDDEDLDGLSCLGHLGSSIGVASRRCQG